MRQAQQQQDPGDHHEPQPNDNRSEAEEESPLTRQAEQVNQGINYNNDNASSNEEGSQYLNSPMF